MPLLQGTRFQQLRELLSGDEAFATTLLTLAIDEFGSECLEWAPETLQLEFAEQFHIQLQPQAMAKLMAGITLVTTNLYYKSLPHFIDLTNALCGSPPSESFDIADAEECAWGITEALLISPPDEDEPFTNDIRGYIAQAAHNEGLIVLPDVLRIGLQDQDYAAQVQYNYQDDPDMFSAVWKEQQNKTQYINEMIRSNLQDLLQQLVNLPLTSVDTKDLIQKLQQEQSILS